MKKFKNFLAWPCCLVAVLSMVLPAQARSNKPLLRAPRSYYSSNYYPYLRWRLTLGMTPNTAPAIADFELDGVSDIIFPAVDGDAKKNTLYRVTQAGDIKWKIALPAPVTAGVTLADVDRDGTLDILLACGKILVCYDAHAHEKWRFTTSEDIVSFPTVADINGDGKPEVIFGANDNYLHVLAYNGKEKWKFHTKSWIVGGASVANIRGDGKLEIVFGSMDFNLYCLDCNGKKLWEYATDDWVEASPVIGDVDHDGGVDVVAASDDGQLYCISRLGTLKWKKYVAEPSHEAPHLIVADFDGEGTRESLVTYPNGSTTMFTAAGEQIWKTTVGGGVVGSPIVADMNGDGVQDLLFATQYGTLTALGIWGNEQWSFSMGQTIVSTPLLADVDRDGKYEIYVANLMSNSRNSGFFSQFKLSVRGGKALWATVKGDPDRTGSGDNAIDYGAALNRGIDYATAWEPYLAGYRPRNGVLPPCRLRVTALPLDDVRGNHDGALDPGETAIFKVQVSNYGKGASYDSLLTIDLGSTLLRLDRPHMYLGWVAPGATKTVVFHLTAPPLAELQKALDGTFRDVAQEPQGDNDTHEPVVYLRPRRKQPSRPQSVKLQVLESNVQVAVADAQVFNVPPLPPTLKVQNYYILDRNTSLTSGNGNGRLDSGESVILRVLLRNDNYTTAEKASATIVSGSHDVLPVTTAVSMAGVFPHGTRQLDFGLRIAKELHDRQVKLTVTTYAKAPKIGAVPPHSDTLTLALGQRGLDTQPPALAFSSPKSRIASSTGAAITVVGTVADVSGIATLRFDKSPVAISRLRPAGKSKWSFSFVRPLKIGENVFPVAATDNAGNSTVQWLRIVRNTSAIAPLAEPAAHRRRRGRRKG